MPPLVERVTPRLLEDRKVIRTFVKRAEVVSAEGTSLVLRTEAGVSRRFTPEGAPDHPEEGALLAGTLRIDLVGEGTLRVRYAEGEGVPENPTPMVVGRPEAPAATGFETGDGGVTVRTAGHVVHIDLKPFVVRVTGTDGRDIAVVGGREKNFFNVWDSYNTGICRSAEGRPIATETFALRHDEAVYGFGEQFIGLDKAGQTIDLNMVEATGVTTPRAYKNVPFFMTTRGYGVFLNHSSQITAWVGSRLATDVQIGVEDDFLDYFLFLGDLRTILGRYTELTGRPTMPPRWSFGFWQSKISYRSAEETLDIVRRYRQHGIPLDVLHLDTHWFREDWRCDLEFDPERFPDPATYLKDMADLGVKVSLWQLPYIPEGSQLFDDLAAVEGFVKDGDGGIYDVGICYTPGFSGVVGCIDFTNPAAVEVYQRHLRRLLDLGARVIKVDFGEQAPLDGVYHDGTPGHRAHNLYPLLYNQAVAEVTESATGERVMWARSAWAGSQRYPLHWGGDSSANWDNLGPQFAGGLSFGLSGFSFWSQDIGGFLGNTGGPLLVRWMQAGLFVSHARIHGAGVRELDRFDDEILRICRDYLHLRHRLLPYIEGAARECVERSLPMARALVLEFEDDPTTWRIADQWLFGPSLLVAPIFDESGRRRVYLPRGVWTDWWRGERIAGPRWVDVDVPLDVLPLYIREGGIVPLGPVMDHTDQRPTDRIDLRVAAFDGAGASLFTVPVNDERIRVSYVADTRGHRVEVGDTTVEFAVELVG